MLHLLLSTQSAGAVSAASYGPCPWETAFGAMSGPGPDLRVIAETVAIRAKNFIFNIIFII